ncbi:MAG: HipA N-terminal domain-containing protein [Spirochaetes bacterium]|nr:HipA N-terminal domain-containing protein [Candidatus Omnitrophota bacterium]MCK5267443.1 HipA N-terminal domain-containing protein [Spirochaetota bacterium]
MKYQNDLNPQDIRALDVFLENRKTRTYVGRLRHGKSEGSYVFEYSQKYLYSARAIPVGPDIPLIKKRYKKDSLFRSFNDRIPFSKNPSYKVYCKKARVLVTEKNQIILLATIGRRGPSSFVFEPVYKEIRQEGDLGVFRKNLGLTIREFSEVFDFSTKTVHNIESNKIASGEPNKRLKILVEFPEVSINQLLRNGGVLSEEKRMKAIQYLEGLISATKSERIEEERNSKAVI